MAQKKWHFCQECNSMFFGGDDVNAGACVGSDPRGDRHIAQGFEFALSFGDGPELPNTQMNWFFCRKCNCLVFIATGGAAGACVRGEGHDATGSFNFHLPHDVPEAARTQKGWRFCRNCGVMHFGGTALRAGKCVQGGTHDGTGSFNFVLGHGTRFIERTVKIDDGPNQIPDPNG